MVKMTDILSKKRLFIIVLFYREVHYFIKLMTCNTILQFNWKCHDVDFKFLYKLNNGIDFRWTRF